MAESIYASLKALPSPRNGGHRDSSSYQWSFGSRGHIKSGQETKPVYARHTPMEIHRVQVLTDDRECRIWLAMTPREEAVDRVLDTIPEGWAATLMERGLSGEGAANLNMAPGEVREMPSNKRVS